MIGVLRDKVLQWLELYQVFILPKYVCVTFLTVVAKTRGLQGSVIESADLSITSLTSVLLVWILLVGKIMTTCRRMMGFSLCLALPQVTVCQPAQYQ